MATRQQITDKKMAIQEMIDSITSPLQAQDFMQTLRHQRRMDSLVQLIDKSDYRDMLRILKSKSTSPSKTASEMLKTLEGRIARLEKQSSQTWDVKGILMDRIIRSIKRDQMFEVSNMVIIAVKHAESRMNPSTTYLVEFSGQDDDYLEEKWAIVKEDSRGNQEILNNSHYYNSEIRARQDF